MTRRAFVVPEAKVVCFWSPKAANSSLGEWLVRGLWAKEHEASGLRYRDFLKETKRVLGFRRAADLAEKGYDSFALVRHPHSRAVSAYVNKYLYNGEKRLDRFGRLESFAQRFIVECAGGDAEAYEGISFVDFLEATLRRVRGREGREPDLNPHWNTQVPFHFRDVDFRYGAVIHLETLDDELPALAARLGIADSFPHRRRNRSGGGAVDGDAAEMSSLEIIRAGFVPSEAQLLTPRARALIDEAYEIDFSVLGYPRQAS